MPRRLAWRRLADAAAAGLASASSLNSRQEPTSHRNSSKKSSTTTIIIAVFFVTSVTLVVAFIVFGRYCRGRGQRSRRTQSDRNYSASVASFQKSSSAGTKLSWYKRVFRRSPHAYQQAEADDVTARFGRELQDMLEEAVDEVQAREAAAAAAAAAPSSASNAPPGSSATAASNVDRNTSIRSVMTLPVYRPKPNESEQVLGREGERDGIDVVVELPPADLDEALRDEEMETLYQIRLARRRQIAEREERRRLRQEARDARDVAALGNLRSEAREATTRNMSEIEELRRGHERIKESRHRAVSSVSYADIGVVRADGTRVCGNSMDTMESGPARPMAVAGAGSESMGLLSDATSVGTGGSRSLFHHRRDRSASSATAGVRLSIDTARSNEHYLPEEGRDSISSVSTANRTPGELSGRSSSQHAGSGGRSWANSSGAAMPHLHSRAGSSPEVIEAADAETDLGDTHMPPPGYDEVSLDDITPVHSRGSFASVGSAASPGSHAHWSEPPPEYPGSPTRTRNKRLSAHMEDLAAEVGTAHNGGNGSGSNGASGRASGASGASASEESSPASDDRRASMRSLGRLQTHQTVPEIVIQPHSAVPREGDGARPGR